MKTTPDHAATAILLLTALALAGCTVPAPSPGLGDEALVLVYDIVYLDDGSLRERRPGEVGHLETAQWLADQFHDPWTVRFVGGTGAEYQALPLRQDLEPYRDPARCRSGDPERVATMQIRNVEARLDNGHPEQVLILAAHWDQNRDTRDGTGQRMPGANDGASGVGLLIAMQGALATLDLPYDLIILLTDAEDGFRDCYPVAGARLYVDKAIEPDVQYRLILLDMVGDPDARFPREANSMASDAALMDLLWDLAPGVGLGANTVASRNNIMDDHIPFIDAGIPSVDIIDGARPGTTFPPYWETVEDTPDKLSADMLERVADWLLATLQDDRFVATWPDRGPDRFAAT
jgi:hypothetical protein